MRKALPNRTPLLLLAGLALLIATLFFSFTTGITTCTDTVNCTKNIKKQTLKDGGELLWESLSRQFVVSMIPE